MSRPTFRITSSINPRVFISAPTVKASRQLIPVSLAAVAAPPIFPVTATSNTNANTAHNPAPLINPTDVRKPVNAKNTGSKTALTTLSMRSAMASARCGGAGSLVAALCAQRDINAARGTMAPATKAPNSACTPSFSVISANTSAPTTATLTTGAPTNSVVGLLARSNVTSAERNHLARAGRNTSAAANTNALVKPSVIANVVHPEPLAPCIVALATASTAARMHHAVASSIAAAAIAMEPTRDVSRLRSSRIRASTGNAVMLMAAPMNKANGRKATPSGARSACNGFASATPNRNGATMLAWLTATAVDALLRRTLRSSRNPTTNMNRTTPNWLSVANGSILSAGNSARRASGATAPSKEGPSAKPAIISPMTAG